MWPFTRKAKKYTVVSHEQLDKEDKEMLSKEKLLNVGRDIEKEDSFLKHLFRKGRRRQKK